MIEEFDVAYFAASVDDPETNRRFARSLEADYPILSDPERTVAEAYGVLTPESGLARRWTFYVARDGTILFVDRAVRPLTAGRDIATRLAELGVARRVTGR
jgi:peroxiredoxin Q/BCP